MRMEERVAAIEERNQRVEGDKAWETSWERKALIVAGTYVTMAVFLSAINAPNPLINALVPTIGYLISTVTIAPIKAAWLAKRRE